MSHENPTDNLLSLPDEERFAESRRRTLALYGLPPNASNDELRAAMMPRNIGEVIQPPSGPRIDFAEPIGDCVQKVTGSNFGSVKACLELMEVDRKVRPDHFFRGFGIVVALDREQIWDDQIYGLWNDVCLRNTEDMYALITTIGYSNGGVDRQTIQKAIKNPQNRPIDFEPVRRAFKEFYPDYT